MELEQSTSEKLWRWAGRERHLPFFSPIHSVLLPHGAACSHCPLIITYFSTTCTFSFFFPFSFWMQFRGVETLEAAREEENVDFYIP